MAAWKSDLGLTSLLVAFSYTEGDSASGWSLVLSAAAMEGSRTGPPPSMPFLSLARGSYLGESMRGVAIWLYWLGADVMTVMESNSLAAEAGVAIAVRKSR